MVATEDQTYNTRDYYPLISSFFISRFGTSMANLAFVFGILHLTFSKTDVGIAFACRSVPYIAVILIGGFVGDTYSRKKIIIYSDVLRFISQITVAIILIRHIDIITVIFAAFFLLGIGDAFFGPSAGAIIPMIVKKDDLQKVNANIGIATSLARIIGPITAGILITYYNIGWIILFDATTYIVSAMIVLTMKIEKPVANGESKLSKFADIRKTVKIINKIGWLKGVMIQLAILNLFAFAPFTIVGPAIFSVRAGGTLNWGGLMMFSGVGAFIGSNLIKKIKFVRPIMVIEIAILSLIVPLLTVAFSTNHFLYVAGGIIYGMAISVVDIYVDILIQREVPTESLSKIIAIFMFTALSIAPIGFLTAGSASSLLGPRTFILSSCVIIFLYSTCMLKKFYFFRVEP